MCVEIRQGSAKHRAVANMWDLLHDVEWLEVHQTGIRQTTHASWLVASSCSVRVVV